MGEKQLGLGVAKGFTIRPAVRTDVDVMSEIRRSAIIQTASRKIGDRAAIDWADNTSNNRTYNAVEFNEVWIAEQLGTPVGWIEIRENFIEGVYVSPKHVERGIGAGLLKQAENRVHASGYEEVKLHSSLNARDFYERLGYQPYGSENRPDTISMIKSFAG